MSWNRHALILVKARLSTADGRLKKGQTYRARLVFKDKTNHGSRGWRFYLRDELGEKMTFNPNVFEMGDEVPPRHASYFRDRFQYTLDELIGLDLI